MWKLWVLYLPSLGAAQIQDQENFPVGILKMRKGKKKKTHTLLALQHCILDLLQTGSDLPKKHLNPPVDGFSLTYPRDNFAL